MQLACTCPNRNPNCTPNRTPNRNPNRMMRIWHIWNRKEREKWEN